jgi:hypothetical protein
VRLLAPDPEKESEYWVTSISPKLPGTERKAPGAIMYFPISALLEPVLIKVILLQSENILS